MDTIGLLIRDIKDIEVLSPKDEIALLKRAKENDKEAISELVRHNIKLVFKMAKGYSKNNYILPDLIQEGTLGLFDAIEKFDLNQNVRFSTYATKWIKKYIYSYLYTQQKSITLPIHMVDDTIKFNKVYENMSIRLGRVPSFDELVEELGFTFEKAISIYNYLREERSLDEKVSEESDLKFMDIIESDYDVTNEVMSNYLIKDLSEVIKDLSLSERELYILEHRSGINNKYIYTLDKIAKKYGLTRERIRQIENNINEKIRKNGEKIKSYVDDKESLSNNYVINKSDNNYRIDKSLYKVLESPKEELKYALRELSKDELDLFHKTFSSPLSYDEVLKFNQIILPKLEYNINKYSTTIKKLDYLENYLSMEELSKYIDGKELIIASMMLGIYDGSCYPIDYIVKQFHISTDDVIEIYQNALKIINEKIINTKEKEKIKKL